MIGKWSHSDWNQILREAARVALPGIGIGIEGQAVELAPLDIGRLRGSITWATEKARDHPKPYKKYTPRKEDEVSAPDDAWTLHVGTNVDYAEYQEYGTRFQPTGQPFLRPALRIYRKPAQAYFAAEIRKAIARYGK